MVETIATVGGTAVALLLFIVAGLRWFYNRGRNEQAIANSIDRQAEATAGNTEATKELAAQVGGLRSVIEGHGKTLTEHHFRLKALEDQSVKVIVERSGS